MVSEPLLWPSSIFRHSSVALASTDSHCQKRVTAVTPNHYLSDLVCSSIKSPNHSYSVIDQTSPIKIQPKTVPKELPCALMVRLSFCLSKTRRMHSHTAHVLGKIPSQSFNRATRYMRSTPLSATSALARQLPCQHHTSFSDVNIQDHWLAMLTVDFLTKVKIFEQGLSWSVFCINSYYGLHFFIWGL